MTDPAAHGLRSDAFAAIHRFAGSGHRGVLGQLVQRQTGAALLDLRIDLLRPIRILPTQKDAASNLGRFKLHLVMDNYAAHKHKNVRNWLEANPRFKVHFTPTHASWMNLVEVWFGLVERQAVRRGVFKSVKDLNGKLRAYIEGWNKRAHPFVWTKTADDILKEANRPNNFKSAPLDGDLRAGRSRKSL